MPGQPGPVYPPGQFSGWNRPSVRASWLGVNGNGDGRWDGEAEPGYSILATSDPSADAKVTQTWTVIDEGGGWSPPPPARDVSAHTDGEGFPGFRGAGGRVAAAPRAVPVSSTCTVFAESEVISLVAGGEPLPGIVKGLHASLASRVAAMARRSGKGEVFMSGGVALNAGMVESLSQALGKGIRVLPEPQLVGALGAALSVLKGQGSA